MAQHQAAAQREGRLRLDGEPAIVERAARQRDALLRRRGGSGRRDGLVPDAVVAGTAGEVGGHAVRILLDPDALVTEMKRVRIDHPEQQLFVISPEDCHRGHAGLPSELAHR